MQARKPNPPDHCRCASTRHGDRNRVCPRPCEHAGRRNAGTSGRAQGQPCMIRRSSSLYTKRRGFFAKSSASVADYSLLTRFSSVGLGWILETLESSPDYSLPPGASGKLPRSRCGWRHSFDCTTGGRRTGEGLEKNSQAWRRLVALHSAHTGRRSAFSKAIITCGASRPARLSLRDTQTPDCSPTRLENRQTPTGMHMLVNRADS